AELGMRLHDRPLALRQRAGLQEDRRGDADLADVVEEGAELEALERRRVEAELAADLERHVGDPAGVGGRVLVVRLECVGQSLDRGEERLLEVVVRAGVLDREPRLVRDAGEEAHRARREPVRVLGDDAAAALPFEMERRNRVVRARLGDAVDGRELLRADRERLRDREKRVRYGAWIAQGLRARANLVLVAPESAWGEVAGGHVLEPDGDAWGAERAGRELDDAVE